MKFKSVLALNLFILLTVSSFADYTTNVYTPNGNPVTAIACTYELSSSEITTINNYYDSQYPTAVRLASASRRYNCHSYAWYYQGFNTIWINDPTRYWSDGSYWQTTLPFSNDKVYYPAGHSAIYNTSSSFTSKWGQAGLYRHTPSGCPYNTYGLRYYYR